MMSHVMYMSMWCVMSVIWCMDFNEWSDSIHDDDDSYDMVWVCMCERWYHVIWYAIIWWDVCDMVWVITCMIPNNIHAFIYSYHICEWYGMLCYGVNTIKFLHGVTNDGVFMWVCDMIWSSHEWFAIYMFVVCYECYMVYGFQWMKWFHSWWWWFLWYGVSMYVWEVVSCDMVCYNMMWYDMVWVITCMIPIVTLRYIYGVRFNFNGSYIVTIWFIHGVICFLIWYEF